MYEDLKRIDLKKLNPKLKANILLKPLPKNKINIWEWKDTQQYIEQRTKLNKIIDETNQEAKLAWEHKFFDTEKAINEEQEHSEQDKPVQTPHDRSGEEYQWREFLIL